MTPLFLALLSCAPSASSAPGASQMTETDPLAGAVQPGDVVASVTPLAGEAVTLPDPGGRYVILELIRSADW